MDPHINTLQDIVRLTIRQELKWSEQRFKRVTMSHDANNNPAELYGEDGKINYRSAGGAGVELGTVGAGGLYGTLGADFSLYGSAADDVSFLRFWTWEHALERLSTQSETITLGHGNTSAALSTGFYFYRGTTLDEEASFGWNETADRFEFMEDVSAPTLAEVLMRTLKLYVPTKIGDITMNGVTGNMEFTDTITGTKTLSELAAGGGAGLWEVSGAYAKLSVARPIDMNSNKITGLAAGAVNGDAVRYEQLAAYLPLAGGTMDSEAGINMNDGSLTNVGGISMTSAETLDMNGGDIVDVDEVKGTTGNSLELDFRGNSANKIYCDTSSPVYLRYNAADAHAFDIAATPIAYIASDGFHMAAGKFIKSVSGDLELRAPSGSKIKFVIG